jgi:hypothetical protein
MCQVDRMNASSERLREAAESGQARGPKADAWEWQLDRIREARAAFSATAKEAWRLAQPMRSFRMGACFPLLAHGVPLALYGAWSGCTWWEAFGLFLLCCAALVSPR